MGRGEACRNLNLEKCFKDMEDIEFGGFGFTKIKKEKVWDLGEAPGAYKDIETVITQQADLVKPIVKLRPLAVVKG